jgi:predicted enzyme related to lactoylglutathione lyase
VLNQIKNMNSAENNLRVGYIEFPVRDINKTKEFYSTILGWKFEDYGPDYTCFHDGRIGGGFYTSAEVKVGGPLVVIYSTDIDAMQKKVSAAGSKIVKPIFEFPGGRRFHFIDPSGHELAIWTDK